MDRYSGGSQRAQGERGDAQSGDRGEIVQWLQRRMDELEGQNVAKVQTDGAPDL